MRSKPVKRGSAQTCWEVRWTHLNFLPFERDRAIVGVRFLLVSEKVKSPPGVVSEASTLTSATASSAARMASVGSSTLTTTSCSTSVVLSAPFRPVHFDRVDVPLIAVQLAASLAQGGRTA